METPLAFLRKQEPGSHVRFGLLLAREHERQ